MASEESYIGTPPIVSLLEDVDTYAGIVFDVCAKTMKDLQTMEQLKSDRGQQVDWRKLGQREVLLTNFLRQIEDIQEDMTDIRRADFGALSLVWGSGAGQSRPKYLVNGALIIVQSSLGKDCKTTSPYLRTSSGKYWI
jgi:hypothetical protein